MPHRKLNTIRCTETPFRCSLKNLNFNEAMAHIAAMDFFGNSSVRAEVIKKLGKQASNFINDLDI